MKISFTCRNCGKVTHRERAHINRSRSIGAPLYCGMTCSGLGRRKNKTVEQKKLEKRLYDMQYRKENRNDLKRRRRESYLRNYDPVKAAAYRKSRMAYHVEYCRRPEYRAKKCEYDRQLRSSKYGAFGDAYRLLADIGHEVRSRMTNYEIRVQNGTINKHLHRR